MSRLPHQPLCFLRTSGAKQPTDWHLTASVTEPESGTSVMTTKNLQDSSWNENKATTVEDHPVPLENLGSATLAGGW